MHRIRCILWCKCVRSFGGVALAWPSVSAGQGGAGRLGHRAEVAAHRSIEVEAKAGVGAGPGSGCDNASEARLAARDLTRVRLAAPDHGFDRAVGHPRPVTSRMGNPRTRPGRSPARPGRSLSGRRLAARSTPRRTPGAATSTGSRRRTIIDARWSSGPYVPSLTWTVPTDASAGRSEGYCEPDDHPLASQRASMWTAELLAEGEDRAPHLRL